MTGPDPQTQAVYDTQAGDYAAKFADRRPAPELDTFIAALPAGARVLDLGCGPGMDAARMRDAGLDVVAVDAAAGMAAEAAHRYGLDITIADFDEIPSLGRFAGIWASFSLLHVARADLPRHFAAIRSALVPPGLFVVGMKTGDGEKRDALGRRYTYVTETELDRLLADAGLTVASRRAGAGEGLDGALAPWIVMTAHA